MTLENTITDIMQTKTRKPKVIPLGITLSAALMFSGCSKQESAQNLDYNQACINCHSEDKLHEKNPDYKHTPGYVPHTTYNPALYGRNPNNYSGNSNESHSPGTSNPGSNGNSVHSNSPSNSKSSPAGGSIRGGFGGGKSGGAAS